MLMWHGCWSIDGIVLDSAGPGVGICLAFLGLDYEVIAYGSGLDSSITVDLARSWVMRLFNLPTLRLPWESVR